MAGAVTMVLDFTDTLGVDGNVSGMDTYVPGESLVVTAKNAIYIVSILR
jgi:hypothetical protein